MPDTLNRPAVGYAAFVVLWLISLTPTAYLLAFAAPATFWEALIGGIVQGAAWLGAYFLTLLAEGD